MAKNGENERKLRRELGGGAEKADPGVDKGDEALKKIRQGYGKTSKKKLPTRRGKERDRGKDGKSSW